MLFSSGWCDSEFLTASPTTLPATERGSLLDNLGGSDPRRRRRWAAAKPLKWGRYRPKFGFLLAPLEAPSPVISFFSCHFYLRPPEIWPQIHAKSHFGTSWRPRSIVLCLLESSH